MKGRFDRTTDEELMKAYRNGEEEAFRTLYARYSGRVYGFLRARLRDQAMADDVFQATFMKLHTTRGVYDAAFPFAPWLFTVCRSVMTDALRKQNRGIEDLDPKALACAVASPSNEAPILPNFEVLSSAQRTAVQLRYQEELGFEEIAKRLETSPANVRQMISRSIKKLRAVLTKGEVQ